MPAKSFAPAIPQSLVWSQGLPCSKKILQLNKSKSSCYLRSKSVGFVVFVKVAFCIFMCSGGDGET